MAADDFADPLSHRRVSLLPKNEERNVDANTRTSTTRTLGSGRLTGPRATCPTNVMTR